ncbi:hypothetical protein PQO03_03555 [Lentisphaera profundi]|uniref:Cardiolipin synthase N-terminal domain-containing protein n=1 Tax=Lentisphaera profundi TaxID=1658616 RepID=A0ABY7VVW2_9BACT|nr:hypothetical protein [Lentisphaera profundi]WDE97032.1 hypothetical protein PQO03_03555 [Lentisphaera profundi]
MNNIIAIQSIEAASNTAIDFLPVNPAQWSPWLILVGLSISLFILSSIACKKTGLNSSKATCCLIPVIGPFIFFWTLAFTPWPIHDKLPDPEDLSKEE